MTEGEARREVVGHWMRKAEEALASADSELSAGRYEFAANRAYYACFYAASAVLLHDGKRFVKHTGLRAGARALVGEARELVEALKAVLESSR